MKEDFNRTYLNTEGSLEDAKNILEVTFPKITYNESEQVVKYKLGKRTRKITFYDLFLNITSYGIPLKARELREILRSRNSRIAKL
tara:strand:- start:293 stop:550 length:258 start_codon:yes stop_codon:yes gene_type:complete